MYHHELHIARNYLPPFEIQDDDEYANYYEYSDNDDDIDDDDDTKNSFGDNNGMAMYNSKVTQKFRTPIGAGQLDKSGYYNGRYICDCGKTYKEDRYMRHHQRWECGKLPSFQCPHCKYCAKRKNSLKSHMQRRHNDYGSIL